MDNSASYADRRGQTKFLAVVFGYLCIGLAITALISFLFPYFFNLAFYDSAVQGYSQKAFIGLLVICGIALIASIIDSIVFMRSISKDSKRTWISFLVYCVCMGIWPGALLTLGVEPTLMGEAFGITSIVFVAMFLIGYFNKHDLSLMGLIAYGLLVGYLLIALIFGIWFWLSPSTFYVWDLVASLIMVTFSMLMIGFDANRMNRSLENGTATNNTALYYAFSFYGDFINIFLRILYILLIARNRR